MTIQSDIQKLNPGALVVLFELDAVSLGDSVKRYFHAGTNELKTDVVWQGNTYVRYPVEAEKFDMTSKGVLPRPTLKIANITGLVGSLTRTLNDLVGAKVTRRRTFVKYLDAVNFTGGVNPTASTTTHFDDDVYYVNRKISENRIFIEFELSSSLDVEGIKLPRRQVIQNVCSWTYRSAECSYAGGAVANVNDVATTILANDVCGKRLKSCKLRFGTYATLPFGGFISAGLSN